MKVYQSIIAVVLVVLSFISCNSSDFVKISGNIKNSQHETIYLSRLTGKEIKGIDSNKINEDGEFSFKLKLPEPGIYRLNFQGKAQIDLCIMGSENIKIEADEKENVENYTVEGSNESLEIKNLNTLMIKAYRNCNELKLKYQEERTEKNEDSLSAKLDDKFNEIVLASTIKIKGFIDSAKNDYLLVYAVNYLDPDVDFKTIDKVYEKVKNNTSSYFTSFAKQIDELKITNVGSMAPEINLPDVDGKNISLSSLKGKFVLVDFWASWCKPCRAESPNMVRIFNIFKNKNFTIYSVSLDKERADWIKAIKDDKLNWIHVSDLMFWNSKAVADYRVQGIPSTFLLDPQGKIIAKNLRGKELENLISEYIK